MNDIDVDIPDAALENDFTIVYKGKEEREGIIIEPIVEIETSKNEFFRKLRYFKNKIYEFIQINEILIHDIYPVEIFKAFINSLKTNKIQLNEKNYSCLYELSSKYQYYELQQKIDAFSKTRPDIQKIVEDFSFENNDSEKEEKLALNLDICLQNSLMINFPIPVLNRILNSPKRIIKDHHLLFQFIKKVINKRSNDKETDHNDYFQILLGSLDYLQMSNEELDELFNNEHFTCVFNCRNSKEQMKTFIEEKKFNQKRMEQLEEQMQKLSSLVLQKEKENEEKISKIEQQIQIQNEIISKNEKENQILMNYIKDLESKIKVLEKKPITGSIIATVESNQMIKGVINLVEENTKLDVNKSKYIINSNSALTLGENEYILGMPIENCSQNFSFMKPSGTYYIHALIIDNYENCKEIVSQPLQTKGISPLTFDYTGNVQSTTLEPGNYKLEVWGAEGGKSQSNQYLTPGKGGYSVGILSLKSKTKLFIHVGQCPTTGNGGWNGGGTTSQNYAGGGGATDISLYGTDGSNDWNNTNHLYSRIIVAGGGGGSGSKSYSQYPSGCGGGINGQDCGGCSNSGGTQTRAGVSNNRSTDQGFGIGGKQTNCCSGGGGSGWYGGSSSNANNGCSTGGAGGSGYVYCESTAMNYPSGCKLNKSFYLTNASTISGNCSFPNTTGLDNEVGHSGNGFAKITLI